MVAAMSFVSRLETLWLLGSRPALCDGVWAKSITVTGRLVTDEDMNLSIGGWAGWVAVQGGPLTPNWLRPWYCVVQGRWLIRARPLRQSS